MTKPRRPITIMPTTWDAGASGQANRAGLIEEPASDFDPNTGRETRNPNGVTRQRRKTMIQVYAGWLTPAQQAAAYTLYSASLGCPDRDPIAAIGEVRQSGSDPMVTAIDKRRAFWDLWRRVPLQCRAVIERVVLDDLPIKRGNHREIDKHRLREGLDAMTG